MMTSTDISLLLSASAIVLSAVLSALVASYNAGKVRKDIEYIRRDLDRIMGLFQLTLNIAKQQQGGN